MPFSAGMDYPEYSFSTGPEVHIWTDEELERLQRALQKIIAAKRVSENKETK